MASRGVFDVLYLPTGARLILSALPGRDGDLSGDLVRLLEQSPDFILSLTEKSELHRLGLDRFPEQARDMEVPVLDFPIPDFGTPSAAQSADWSVFSQPMQHQIDHGGCFVIHCHGGKGRTGMICLRLLVDRGVSPADGLELLRETRPGSVETDAQYDWASGI